MSNWNIGLRISRVSCCILLFFPLSPLFLLIQLSIEKNGSIYRVLSQERFVVPSSAVLLLLLLFFLARMRDSRKFFSPLILLNTILSLFLSLFSVSRQNNSDGERGARVRSPAKWWWWRRSSEERIRMSNSSQKCSSILYLVLVVRYARACFVSRYFASLSVFILWWYRNVVTLSKGSLLRVACCFRFFSPRIIIRDLISTWKV